MVQLDECRPAGRAGERHTGGEKLGDQCAHLLFATGGGQADGAGGGQTRELLAGGVEIAALNAPVAQRTEQVAHKRLRVAWLHPVGHRLDTEKIAAKLGDLKAVRIDKF